MDHFHFFLPLLFMCCSSLSPKCIAKKIVRVGFGLALAFVGFAHYQDTTFAETVGRGLNSLESLGMLWGYVLPGLMILGGLLLAFGIYANVAAAVTAIALVSIPAGLMLKSAIGGISLGDTMPAVMNAFMWIVVFIMVQKKKSGGSLCGAGACGMNACDSSSVGPCGMDNWACPTGACECPPMPKAKAVPVKSTPAMPVATKKPMPKKKVVAKKK